MKKFFLLLTVSIMLTTYLNAQTKIETVELRNDSTFINYIQNGEGETTLLFLHGWCINKNYWDDQIQYFSNDYKVIAIDLPGFGHSSAFRNNWTTEEYAKDVIAFINKMKLKNVVLIGHSMSGDIILEAALHHHPAIKGVIGIDNFKMVGVEFTPEQINEYTSFMQMMENDYENMVSVYADQYLFHASTDSLIKAMVKSDLMNSDRDVSISSIKAYIEYGMKETGKLAQLPFQLHLLNSDASPTNVEGLKQHCKNSFKVFDIHATGHYPMIEKPEEFNRILEEILNEIQ